MGRQAWWSVGLVLLLLTPGWAPGCTFQIPGLEGTDGTEPLPDLRVTLDATADFSPVLSDTTMALDLGDLTPPPTDLQGVPPLTPTHFAGHYLTDGKCDITLSVDVVIDTSATTIGGTAVPSGCTATVEMVGGREVWLVAVRNFTLDPGVLATVKGTRPLIIVAASDIFINGKLEGGAVGAVPGPGGSAAGAGTGKGPDGTRQDSLSTGGAGGGFGSAGGHGGDVDDSQGHMRSGPSGGVTYPSDPTLVTSLPGGSGGGRGGTPACTAAVGGAGGGVIQLTARAAITFAGSGTINVGGGGGHAGCRDSAGDSAGGGGGSGGTIYLEAPTLTIQEPGTLTANGGGGGAGSDVAVMTPTNGADGLQSDLPAPGGIAGLTPDASISLGSDGGKGAALVGGGATGGGLSARASGGGGGGAGRIVLRVVDFTIGDATISPAPTLALDITPRDMTFLADLSDVPDLTDDTDMSMPDLGVDDASVPADATVLADQTVLADATVLADQAVLADQTVVDDMTVLPDMTVLDDLLVLADQTVIDM